MIRPQEPFSYLLRSFERVIVLREALYDYSRELPEPERAACVEHADRAVLSVRRSIVTLLYVMQFCIIALCVLLLTACVGGSPAAPTESACALGTPTAYILTADSVAVVCWPEVVR